MMKLMQITKKIWIGFFVLLFVASLYAMSSAENLQVGFFTIEPHTIVEAPDTYKGAAIEYFSRVADLMGISSVSFQELPLARLVQSLDDEKIDVILFLAKAPERERMFRYPEAPYSYSQSGLAVAFSSPVQAISSVEDILPLRIGILGDGYLSPFMHHGNLQLEPIYGNSPILRNLMKLMNSRIDAVYVPDLNVIRFEAWKHGYDAEVRFVSLPEPLTPNYSVFSPKSAEKYLVRYEQALKELQETLAYEEVLEEYLGAAISD
jgi:ABC-type amino acid transport substrate-binding protein